MGVRVGRRSTGGTTGGRGRGAVAALVGVATAVVVLSGCSGWGYEEDICSKGEYPVLAVNDSGSACVADGEEPPEGMVRYPEGKVPQKVGDKWDEYWQTRTLDENGKVVELP